MSLIISKNRKHNTSIHIKNYLVMLVAMLMIFTIYNYHEVKASEVKDNKKEESVSATCDTKKEKIEKKGIVKEDKAQKNNIPKAGESRFVLYVNKQLNCVTAFWTNYKGEEIPIRTMICSCGKNGRTPEGTYRTSDYYEWRNMIDGSWGRYAVRFNGMVLFHSVPYHTKSPDDLEWDQYNLLGTSASLACVRLTCEDAKWVYDHCPKGTKVVVYSDDEVMGPWEIPSAQKIDENLPYRGWDPTDDDENNPWNDKEVTTNTKTIKPGE